MISFASQQLEKLGLTEEQSEPMVEQSKVLALQAKRIIWQPGNAVCQWMYIVSGAFAVSQPMGDASTFSLDFKGAGSWIGQQEIFLKKATSWTYSCITPVQVLCFTASSLLEFFEKYPRFALSLCRSFAGHSKKMTGIVNLLEMFRKISLEVR